MLRLAFSRLNELADGALAAFLLLTCGLWGHLLLLLLLLLLAAVTALFYLTSRTAT